MADDEEVGDAGALRDRHLRLRDGTGVRDLDTLREIEDALSKFDAGTYGRCESCGNQIAEARLEAMPAARLCIDCASHRR